MSSWDSVANSVQFNLEISKTDLVRIIPFQSKILDFGCGYGRISDFLSSIGYRNFVGVDNSKEMITRGASEYPNLDLRYNNSNSLPFPDSDFDAVLTCAVFTCIDDLEVRKTVFSNLNIVILY